LHDDDDDDDDLSLLWVFLLFYYQSLKLPPSNECEERVKERRKRGDEFSFLPKFLVSRNRQTKNQKFQKFPSFSSFFLKREGRRNQENQTRLRHVCRCLVTKTQKFAHKLPLSLSNSR